MSQIHPRRIHCPLCSEEFDGWLVLAGPDRGPLSSELRRYTETEDPIPKQVNGCPGCGYTGSVSAFEEMAPKADQSVPTAAVGAFFSQAAWEDAHDPMLADRPVLQASTLGEQLAEHLAATASEAQADPALRYEHHAQVERWLGSGPLREGDSWLRAAWLHDDADRPKESRR
ncbi:MAG: hypothetical protein VX498_09845, partial [Myxococcota bacterium]|nr:hypothetical protein [Myxococcota bacterium]